VAGASSVDADKGGNSKELLAFEYESGDEFEAERIREFADWFKDLDTYKEVGEAERTGKGKGKGKGKGLG
jgi:hypothetical protein